MSAIRGEPVCLLAGDTHLHALAVLRVVMVAKFCIREIEIKDEVLA